MPDCPRCKEEITELIEVMIETIETPVWLDDNGFWHSGIAETYDSELIQYKCPECQEALFYELSEAERFLKG